MNASRVILVNYRYVIGQTIIFSLGIRMINVAETQKYFVVD